MVTEDLNIPDEIFEQLERVRASGRINMMLRRNVQAIANSFDCYALVTFIEEQPKAMWPEILAEFGRWRKGREIDGGAS